MANAKGTIATEVTPAHLVFETDHLKVEFFVAGTGVAVVVPDWRKEALVLQPFELRQLHALIGGVLSKL